MTAHNRKLKTILLDIGGTTRQAQLKTWKMNNNTKDGDVQFVFAEGEEFVDDGDPDYSLDLTFFADWRSIGISRYLVQHDGEQVTFQLDHLPDVPGEHVRWTGQLKIKAPSVGGDARATEETEVTLAIIGKPTFTEVV